MDFRLNCEDAMCFDTKKFLSYKKAEKLHVNISSFVLSQKTWRRSFCLTTGSSLSSAAKVCTCWT